MPIKVILLLAIFVIDIQKDRRFKDNFELLFQIRAQKIPSFILDFLIMMPMIIVILRMLLMHLSTNNAS